MDILKYIFDIIKLRQIILHNTFYFHNSYNLCLYMNVYMLKTYILYIFF